MNRRQKFGDLLVEKKLLSPVQLAEAIAYSKQENKKLGQVLVELNAITEEQLLDTLSEQLGTPFFSLSDYQFDTKTVESIPEAVVRGNRILPLFIIGNTLSLAMEDPTDIQAIDLASRLTNLRIEPVLVSARELSSALDHIFGSERVSDELVEIIGEPIDESVDPIAASQLANDAPVVRLVNHIFSSAIRERASDIHFNPDEKGLRVRFRVDGVLREVETYPHKSMAVILSRVKIMANLDIAERRIPQDGRVPLQIDNKSIDMRVSSLPTSHGENIVCRILDKSNLQVDLSKIGLDAAYDKVIRMLSRSNGIVLVTGPTGSGKTTTLYSAMGILNKIDVNIITVEDPIEYKLPLLRQVQVNVKAGLTFASGLRSILRQDPDIVMVGEIRDRETAKIAVEAALTGHLVLSTLHTNNAPGALTRLVDMEVEPFLVASATAGVIAQRLVRKVCAGCAEEYEPGEVMVKSLGLDPTKGPYRFKRGKGCRTCNGVGYKGRLGIFEVFEMNDEIRELVVSHASTDALRRAAVKSGMMNLRDDGIAKVLSGVTTPEEVLRVTSLD
ncbi:MAG: ATPase, T2SS/T4P/T4SS family [bacterium]|nr:ATPase, T2SS/T4P/T4SS family [bacterium]